jgi:hypothetical protein
MLLCSRCIAMDTLHSVFPAAAESSHCYSIFLVTFFINSEGI